MTRLLVALLFFVSSVASAAVPLSLAHQGRLVRADGQPETGPVRLVFSLYRAATGDTAVWTETQSVALDRGFYSVTLGATTPFTEALFAEGALHLGVGVESRAELAPRVALSPAAFAIRAGRAEVADRATTSADVEPKVAAHAANADAHHSSTSDGLAITPASVAIKNTDVSLDASGLTLGPQANQTVSGAQLATLTGGGNADALHTHAGAGGGGLCYQQWGDATCATGFTAVMSGAAMFPIAHDVDNHAAGAPICVKNPPSAAGVATSYNTPYTWSDGSYRGWSYRMDCAILLQIAMLALLAVVAALHAAPQQQPSGPFCLVTASAMALEAVGAPIASAELARRVTMYADGTSWLELQRAAAAMKVRTLVFLATDTDEAERLVNAGAPLVLGVMEPRGKHALVLLGVEKGAAWRIVDPRAGVETTVPRDTLLVAWEAGGRQVMAFLPSAEETPAVFLARSGANTATLLARDGKYRAQAWRLEATKLPAGDRRRRTLLARAAAAERGEAEVP